MGKALPCFWNRLYCIYGTEVGEVFSDTCASMYPGLDGGGHGHGHGHGFLGCPRSCKQLLICTGRHSRSENFIHM